MNKNRFSVIFSLFVIALLSCIFTTNAFAADELNFDAIYGSCLIDVKLPDGYAWSNEAPDKIKVGDVGINNFKATYTTEAGEKENIDVKINVLPAYFTDIVVETDGNKYYTGNPVEPEVSVYFDEEKLVKDKDYIVTYADNVDVGIAKAIIEGIGNFKGKNIISFFIEKIDVEGISLSTYEFEIAPKDSYQLKAIIYPVNATLQDIVWVTSDESIATVDENGIVTAVKNGVTYITAISKDGDYEATCVVNVVTHLADMKISVGNVRLFYKDTYQLKTVIMPYDTSDKTIVWSTSDAEVATVNENGIVTAVGRGTATITAITVDGEITDTCVITVNYNWWQRIIWLFLGCIWYFK